MNRYILVMALLLSAAAQAQETKSLVVHQHQIGAYTNWERTGPNSFSYYAFVPLTGQEIPQCSRLDVTYGSTPGTATWTCFDPPKATGTFAP